MIIEVDDKTGVATTYKSVGEFTMKHDKELSEQYKKRILPKVLIEMDFLPLLQEMLPEGTSPIKRIYEHTGYIVVNCENGETHSLDRCAEYPHFKFYK